MTYEIKNYSPDYIERQVDLVWEVTNDWKYPFGTSYESVKKQYSADSFDGSTRFYAFENDKLLGYVTSAVVKDEKNGDYGNLRFPIVKGNDTEITDALFEAAVKRFREIGIQKIKSPAGKGMGNTFELTKKYGYEEGKKFLLRAIQPIDQITVSGKTEDVEQYTELHVEKVKNIFVNKMGLPEPNGERVYNSSIKNRERKLSLGPNRSNWLLHNTDGEITGFSRLERSDYNPETGQLPPIWTIQSEEGIKIIDKLLSTHIKELKPHGLKRVLTFLHRQLFGLESIYNKFGFNFDATYLYEKTL